MRNTLIFAGIALLLLLGGCNSYNTMVKSKIGVDAAWANVQSAYQRRSDLISNLIEVVKGATDFEKSTLVDVVNARAKATQVTIDPSNITPEKLAEFEKAQSQMTSSLSRLLVVSENYPQLQATQQFRDLSFEVAGTENRIKVERDRYTEIVRNYNSDISVMPRALLARMFGFNERPFFKADEGTDKAPKIDFGK
jgi:LemA protein